jgi:hypothetical protein
MTEELTEKLNALILGHTDQVGDLAGGAELVVYDPDGSEAFRGPLARMWRLDEDGETLWIRPLTPGGWSNSAYVFSLSEVRRRALSLDQVTIDTDGIVLVQRTGQTARIQPVSESQTPLLDHWDTFTLTILSAEDEAAVEELLDDSWYGQWG